MRAFINHAGLNSVLEAMNSGVPQVCIPTCCDTFRAANMAERLGVARVLQRFNVTEQSLTEALAVALNDKKSGAFLIIF